MKKFGKRQAIAIKGIAIQMMLWHHLYSNMDGVRKAGMDTSFTPFPEYNMVNIAKVLKICVSLFAIVSGYGLYLDFSRSSKREIEWVGHRLKKLMTDYWFVFLLAFFITMIIDKRPIKIYFGNNLWEGCVNLVLDFLGLANIFESSTMEGTWWYMSAAIMYIVLTPIFFKNKNYLWLIFAATSVLPRLLNLNYLGGNNPYMFLCAFEIGMIAAHYNLVNICINSKRRGSFFLLGILFIFWGYRLYTYLPWGKYWEVCWAFFPMLIIIFSIRYLVDLPIIGSVLFYFGKYSYFMFLTHTFVRWTYGRHFIYNRNCFVSYVLLLLISLGLAILCEKLEGVFRFRYFVDKVLNGVVNKYKEITYGEQIGTSNDDACRDTGGGYITSGKE